LSFTKESKVNLDQTEFVLDEEQWEAFSEILAKPISENQALQKLLNSKAPWKEDEGLLRYVPDNRISL
jgi:uncharacterized protein (DUF1778 family)